MLNYCHIIVQLSVTLKRNLGIHLPGTTNDSTRSRKHCFLALLRRHISPSGPAVAVTVTVPQSPFPATQRHLVPPGHAELAWPDMRKVMQRLYYYIMILSVRITLRGQTRSLSEGGQLEAALAGPRPHRRPRPGLTGPE